MLLDVLQIFAGRSLGRIALAHVTESTSELGETLAIAAVAKPRHRQMIGLAEMRPSQQRHSRFVEEFHGRENYNRSNRNREYARSRSTVCNALRAATGIGSSAGSYFTMSMAF